MSEWHVYIVRCAKGSLYTGIATDVQRRLREHVEASGKGAKYLKGKGPLQLVWQTGSFDRSQALKLESRIKRMPKLKKEALLRGDFCLAED